MTSESHQPTAAELVDAWEHARAATPGRRGLVLLALAEPGTPAETLGGWSVGRRDAALLALHERTFGPRLEALASCPACAESIELEFRVGDVVIGGAAPPSDLKVRRGSFAVTFRLPTAVDLATLEPGMSPERRLLEACVLEARAGDEAVATEDLPEQVVESVAAAMAEADPQAEVELALACPECGTGWQVEFDVVGFVWLELDALATRVLRDVATLASAFGWSERDILAMSPFRRRHYVELAVA